MDNQYFENIYTKRLNRYGKDYQSRIEGVRRKEFEDFLLKSPNRVDFKYQGQMVGGVLEQYKQDYTETQGYLLTQKEIELPNGTILSLRGRDQNEQKWMVWWLEQIKAGGYNRYIILKMNCQLEWTIGSETKRQYAHYSGSGASAIRDSLSEGYKEARFLENNQLYMFITPYKDCFEKDFYCEILNGKAKTAFRVTSLDNQTTEGVSYLSVEEIAKKDLSPLPSRAPNDPEEEFFWLEGGAK